MRPSAIPPPVPQRPARLPRGSTAMPNHTPPTPHPEPLVSDPKRAKALGRTELTP
jgi:hypothetical protein